MKELFSKSKPGELVYEVNAGYGIVIDKEEDYIDVGFNKSHQWFNFGGIPICVNKEPIFDEPTLYYPDGRPKGALIKEYLAKTNISLNTVYTDKLLYITEYVEEKYGKDYMEEIIEELINMLKNQDIFIVYLVSGSMKSLWEDIKSRNYFSISTNYSFLFINRHVDNLIIDAHDAKEAMEMIGRGGANIRKMVSIISKKLNKRIKIKIDY